MLRRRMSAIIIATMFLIGCSAGSPGNQSVIEEERIQPFIRMSEDERYGLYKEYVKALDSASKEARQTVPSSAPLSQQLIDDYSKRLDELAADSEAELRQRYNLS